MKNKVAIFAIIVFVFFGQYANAQTYIPNQAVFNAMFAAAPVGEITFTDDAGLFPYIFGVTDPGEEPLDEEVEFTIDAGEILFIEDDLNIQLADGVSLFVFGMITNAAGGGDPDDQIVFERFAALDPWDAIVIEGDGDVGDEDGIMELANATFTGGGGPDDAGGRNPEEDPDWRGLIVLQGDNDPELILGTDDGQGKCFLENSLSNGISVVGETFGASVELYNVQMTSTTITLCGIKFGDDRDDDRLTNNLIIDHNTTVKFCGAHGLAVYWHWEGEYLIENSVFDNNGTNNPRENEEELGAGIYFWESDGHYEQESIIDIIDTEVKHNSWDGIRINDIAGLVHITDCEIDSNGQRGIYYDFTALSRLGFVEGCNIIGNNWEGIFVQKGNDPYEWRYGGIKIRGNTFKDNAADDTDFPGIDERLANIRLHGNIAFAQVFDDEDDNEFTEIRNNILIGANSGICIENLDNPGDNPNGWPANIICRNNIQYNANYQGLRLEDYAIIGNDPIVFYNNIFHGNGTDIDDEEAGIWVGEDCPDRADEGNWIQNNILSSNEDFGIFYDVADDDPNFTDNGFWQNGDNVEGCTSNPAVELGINDPLYVSLVADAEDFHLFWNCEMINAGDAGNDPNAVSFDDALNPDDDDIDRDGTRNDIGAYGGPFAADFDYEPYNVIDTPHDDLDETLLREYYVAKGDYFVDNAGHDAVLAIDPGTYIEHDDDVTLKVIAGCEINADGTFPLPIIFTSYGAVEWDKIYLPQGSSVGSTFEYCWVKNSYKGIQISSVSSDTDGEAVQIDNCIFSDISSKGIEVFDSDVDILGNVEAWNPADPIPDIDITDEDHFNQVRNVGYRGIEIQFSDGDLGAVGTGEETTVTNTKVLFCGIEDDEDPDDHLDYTGIYMFYSDAVVEDASIFANHNTGTYLAASGPDLNPSEIAATSTDWRDNGPDVEDVGAEGVGAELYLCWNSDVDVERCDIVDVEGDAANDYSIYMDDAASSIFAHRVFYGIDDEENWTEINHVSATGDLLPQNYSFEDNVSDAENDNDWVANFEITPYRRALALIKDGSFRAAAEIFVGIIRDDPTGIYAGPSVRRLFPCYRQFNNGMRDLREMYTDLIDADNPQLTRQIKLMIPRTFMAERLYDDALAYLANTVEVSNDPVARGLSRIAELTINSHINNNRVDSKHDSRMVDVEISEILNELRQLGDESTQIAVPSEFGLTGAYPNPFNSSVRIGYQLDAEADISLMIFDLKGRHITTLHEGKLSTGKHSAFWDASESPSGVYLCRLESGNRTQTLKLTLTK